MRVDCVIVGQGIAGSCIAFELIRRGRKVLIFDDSHRGAACLVAAGVINPITGQRLVKSWRSDAAHPYAKDFYARAERALSRKFFHDRKILQLCKSEGERELWRARAGEAGYAPFIGGYNPPKTFPALNDSFGSYFIEHSAWVETSETISAFRDYFVSVGALRIEEFCFQKLKASAARLEYGEISFEKIIFCDGARAVSNPYFSWLPYRPAKGEILRLRVCEELPEHIVHRGHWIMKCRDGSARIGSTWDREHPDGTSTAGAREELLSALRPFFKRDVSAEVLEHSAGVRPCTATTRPHIGEHPADSRILSFNGFGSKGFALSPYFAKNLADYFDGIAAIDPEADLKRHAKKFFPRSA